MSRNSYIESELNKWRERYEISFEQEFDLKLLLELQFQIIITPKEHIKSISELVHTKNRIMQNLCLKPKLKPSSYKYDILIKLEKTQHRFITDLLDSLIPSESIVNKHVSHLSSTFETDKFKVRTVLNDNLSTDIKADYMFEITNVSE